MLDEQDLIRYERQILYPNLGRKGQERLKDSHVIVVGLGGLGSPASIYIACAGVGRITIVDSDQVELSNLNRQILHFEEDIGTKKTESAENKLQRLNPSVRVTPIFERITSDNALEIIGDSDIVVDAMDNFEGRFIVNAACVAKGIPMIHGGIHGLIGAITTIIPGETPCLACIFPLFTQQRGKIPVFGVTPGVLATLQATEVIKYLAGFGELLTSKMLYVNVETMEFNTINLVRQLECQVCGVVRGEG